MDLNKERLEGTNTFFKWLFLYYIFFKILAILILGYTGRDDSHTTYFVSDMIASGYGIINFSGENVEQSSSLAFSVILSIPVLFFPQITAADAGPVTSFFLNELFIGFLCLMLLKISQPLWIGLIVGLQAPIIYWSLSGMETSLYLFLLLLYVLFYSNILNAKSLNQLGLFVVAFLLALTRPEGVFIVVCVSLGVTIFKKFKNNELNFSLLAITLGGGACAILARLALGLDFFPNPVYSKQDLSIFGRLNSGVVYFAKTFLDHPALSIVAFFSLFYLIVKLFTGEQRLLMLRASLVSLVLSAGFFALLSGGDWMESGRFLVPVFSFAIFGLLIESGRKFRRLIGAGLLVVSFLEVGYTAIQKYGGIPVFYSYRYHAMNYRPSFWEKFSRIHARDLSFVDKFIGEINNNPNSEITIASAQAGMVPYYVRQNMRQKLRFIDLLGLTSKDVQNCLMWPVDPYSQWPATSECLTEPIDYIFDLDNQNFDRMSLLISTGCTEVFREEVVLNQPSWKHERVWRQFLVKCSSD